MANSQRYTREIPHRYRLEAQKFAGGNVTLANRYIDPVTGSKEFEKITLNGFGTIVTFTIIHIAADNFARETPFPVAIIKSDEGAMITAQIVDCNHEEVKIGGRVEFVFRKLTEEGNSGIINYGYKAVLA